MSERVEVRPGAYHDSVTLLQVSRAVAQVEGVDAAQVAMATDLNVEVLRRMGFDIPAGAGPNDLVVALRAVDDDALAAAEAAVVRELAGGRPSDGAGQAARRPPPHHRFGSRRRARCDARRHQRARAACLPGGDGRARRRPGRPGLQ